MLIRAITNSKHKGLTMLGFCENFNQVQFDKVCKLIVILSLGFSSSVFACKKPPVSGYDRVDCLKEGLAGVKKNGQWGFVNQTGQLVIPIQYDEVGMFTKGVALVNRGGQIVFINKAGQSVIPPSRQYGYARELRDSVAQP